jgi:hypothetical protein
LAAEAYSCRAGRLCVPQRGALHRWRSASSYTPPQGEAGRQPYSPRGHLVSPIRTERPVAPRASRVSRYWLGTAGPCHRRVHPRRILLASCVGAPLRFGRAVPTLLLDSRNEMRISSSLHVAASRSSLVAFADCVASRRGGRAGCVGGSRSGDVDPPSRFVKGQG